MGASGSARCARPVVRRCRRGRAPTPPRAWPGLLLMGWSPPKSCGASGLITVRANSASVSATPLKRATGRFGSPDLPQGGSRKFHKPPLPDTRGPGVPMPHTAASASGQTGTARQDLFTAPAVHDDALADVRANVRIGRRRAALSMSGESVKLAGRSTVKSSAVSCRICSRYSSSSFWRDGSSASNMARISASVLIAPLSAERPAPQAAGRWSARA